jgi:ABC-type Fe3+ transport system permease subunit
LYFLSRKISNRTQRAPESLGAGVAQWARLLDLTAHTSLSPIRRGFALSFVNSKKGCTQPVACPWSVVLSGYSGFLHH